MKENTDDTIVAPNGNRYTQSEARWIFSQGGHLRWDVLAPVIAGVVLLIRLALQPAE